MGNGHAQMNFLAIEDINCSQIARGRVILTYSRNERISDDSDFRSEWIVVRGKM